MVEFDEVAAMSELRIGQAFRAVLHNMGSYPGPQQQGFTVGFGATRRPGREGGIDLVLALPATDTGS